MGEAPGLAVDQPARVMHSWESKGEGFFSPVRGKRIPPSLLCLLRMQRLCPINVVGQPESQVGCDLQMALNIQVLQQQAALHPLARAALQIRLDLQSYPLLSCQGGRKEVMAPTILAVVLSPG